MGRLVFMVVLHLLQATLNLLTFIKYIILQKNLSCWYPIWKISTSVVYNVGFSLLLGRICVNEDFYDVLAQVITFHIFLKSDTFEKKTKLRYENSPGPCWVYEDTPK